VLVEIVKGDGDTVVSGELIAQIDTEAKAAPLRRGRLLRPKGCACAAPPLLRPRPGRHGQPVGAQDPRREGHVPR
jgi:2-oxoglutarate dehydrogenase E2 component (dihydrolipoamide succinyltransferase)